MNLKTLLALSIESALNAYLRMDPEAVTGMERLAGRVIGFEVTGLNFILFCMPATDRVQVLPEFDGEPDAVIKGSPISFTLMGILGDPRKALSQGALKVTGDLQVGQAFYELLQAVEIDWEEMLAQRIGDIPAHQIGRLARSIGAWTNRTRDSLRMNLTEYLQEEVRVVPTRLELEAFMDDVDTLRSDVDRLAARVERLSGFFHKADQETSQEDPGGD